MDFEEYFRKNFNDGLSEPSKYMLRFTFEAGQQSKQAEIDALKDCITNLVKQKNKANAKLNNIQEIVELKTSGSFTSVLRKIDAISEELLK